MTKRVREMKEKRRSEGRGGRRKGEGQPARAKSTAVSQCPSTTAVLAWVWRARATLLEVGSSLMQERLPGQPASNLATASPSSSPCIAHLASFACIKTVPGAHRAQTRSTSHPCLLVQGGPRSPPRPCLLVQGGPRSNSHPCLLVQGSPRSTSHPCLLTRAPCAVTLASRPVQGSTQEKQRAGPAWVPLPSSHWESVPTCLDTQ
jgi:hypothetical protein